MRCTDPKFWYRRRSSVNGCAWETNSETQSQILWEELTTTWFPCCVTWKTYTRERGPGFITFISKVVARQVENNVWGPSDDNQYKEYSRQPFQKVEVQCKAFPKLREVLGLRLPHRKELYRTFPIREALLGNHTALR
jgi:hypothetical protein